MALGEWNQPDKPFIGRGQPTAVERKYSKRNETTNKTASGQAVVWRSAASHTNRMEEKGLELHLRLKAEDPVGQSPNERELVQFRGAAKTRLQHHHLLHFFCAHL